MDYILKCNPPTFVNYGQKTMMQVKATHCTVQSSHWLPVSRCVCIFHMTLLIQQKVKGKGMMNFKCQQEDHCGKDLLVSFLPSEFPLSSLDALLSAVTGPVCLYQQLATLTFPRMQADTHEHISNDEFVNQHAHLFLTISYCVPTLPASLYLFASVSRSSSFLHSSAHLHL